MAVQIDDYVIKGKAISISMYALRIEEHYLIFDEPNMVVEGLFDKRFEVKEVQEREMTKVHLKDIKLIDLFNLNSRDRIREIFEVLQSQSFKAPILCVKTISEIDDLFTPQLL